jgi:hypothetical protein
MNYRILMIMNFLFCSLFGVLAYIVYFLHQSKIATEKLVLKVEQLEKLVIIDKEIQEIANTQSGLIDKSILSIAESSNDLLKFLIIGGGIFIGIGIIFPCLLNTINEVTTNPEGPIQTQINRPDLNMLGGPGDLMDEGLLRETSGAIGEGASGEEVVLFSIKEIEYSFIDILYIQLSNLLTSFDFTLIF